MRVKLIELFDALEGTLPKYEMKRSNFIARNSEMNDECKALYEHLNEMGSIVVTPDVSGVPRIQSTPIRVLTSLGRGAYIDSRYGKLVIPVKVNFL